MLFGSEQELVVGGGLAEQAPVLLHRQDQQNRPIPFPSTWNSPITVLCATKNHLLAANSAGQLAYGNPSKVDPLNYQGDSLRNALTDCHALSDRSYWVGPGRFVEATTDGARQIALSETGSTSLSAIWSKPDGTHYLGTSTGQLWVRTSSSTQIVELPEKIWVRDIIGHREDVYLVGENAQGYGQVFVYDGQEVTGLSAPNMPPLRSIRFDSQDLLWVGGGPSAFVANFNGDSWRSYQLAGDKQIITQLQAPAEGLLTVGADIEPMKDSPGGFVGYLYR